MQLSLIYPCPLINNHFNHSFYMLTIKHFCYLGIFLLAPYFLVAQTGTPKKKIKVFLLGTFHFHNPGLDLAKTKDTDILSAKSQQEIQEVVTIIAKQAPSKIFFEAPVKYQPKMDSLFKVYMNGGLQDDKDEVTQIGFRLMKQLGIKQSYCVDANGNFPADSLIKTWETSGQQAYLDAFMKVIRSYEKESNEQIANNMSIKKRLYLMNTQIARQKDLAFYSAPMVMKAGQQDNFIGADLTSEWYKRNIRIYSNIMRQIQPTDTCIFIMFGASHIPILEHLFALQAEEFELIDVAKLLR